MSAQRRRSSLRSPSLQGTRGALARDRIVYAAMELFATRGYEATSIADILAKAKVRSGSLYFQFKNKEAVLTAVLDAYLDGLWPMVMNPAFARTTDPIERVFAVLEDYRGRLVSTGLTYTCPIGRLALEVGERIPAARRRIAANFAQWAGAIEACLVAAGPRLPATLDRAATATFVLSLMEGAVMQSKTSRSLAPFDATVSQLRTYLTTLERENVPARPNHRPSARTGGSARRAPSRRSD